MQLDWLWYSKRLLMRPLGDPSYCNPWSLPAFCAWMLCTSTSSLRVTPTMFLDWQALLLELCEARSGAERRMHCSCEAHRPLVPHRVRGPLSGATGARSARPFACAFQRSASHLASVCTAGMLSTKRSTCAARLASPCPRSCWAVVRQSWRTPCRVRCIASRP